MPAEMLAALILWLGLMAAFLWFTFVVPVDETREVPEAEHQVLGF